MQGIQDGSVSNLRGYVCGKIEPQKNQVTMVALKHLQKFIDDAFAPPMAKSKIIEGSGKKLCKSEKKVFDLLAEGFDTKETAKILSVKLSTVQSCISRVYGKYGVKDRQKAIERYLKEKANE